MSSYAKALNSFFKTLCLCSNAGERRIYHRNEMIFERGIQSEGLFYLIKGKVKIYSDMADGTERVFAILSAPDVFGETETFDTRPRMVSARAHTYVEVMCWDRAALIEAVKDCPELALSIIFTLGTKLRRLTIREEEFMPPRSLGYRLASVLLEHEKYSIFSDQGEQYLRITHSELACVICSTRAEVSRKLSFFTDMGYIFTRRGEIEILDRDGLQMYLDSS